MLVWDNFFSSLCLKLFQKIKQKVTFEIKKTEELDLKDNNILKTRENLYWELLKQMFSVYVDSTSSHEQIQVLFRIVNVSFSLGNLVFFFYVSKKNPQKPFYFEKDK